MHASILLMIVGGATLALANTPISVDKFKTDPLAAVQAAAPQWHFDQKTCFPTDATNGKGGMNPGLPPDNCNELKTNHNCPKEPPMKGANTEANSFPTYWEVVYCTADKSWRVLYDLYFPKDTGHRHDWEWAIVKWVDDGTGKNMWKRERMFFEHEGDIGESAWGDLPNTYTDASNIDKMGQKGLDHAKLYVAKWHHSVWDHPDTSGFANTCPPDAGDDYRSDDYRYESGKNLVHGSVIKASWDYGSADSYPPAFLPNAKHDMCRYGGSTG